MKCHEFKRLALSDPNSSDLSFVDHRDSCPDCTKYVAEILKMDRDLNNSLQVSVPSDLIARLQLASEMEHTTKQRSSAPRYAIAASFAIALFVGGFMLSSGFGPKVDELNQDYASLLSGVVEHVNHKPMTPVWGNARANKTVNSLLASYDGGLQMKSLENLQFGRICPMGKYRGLHATLESPNGPTTFAYIKGEPLGDIIDTNYDGYITRVKPVRGGNLVIVSRTQQSLEDADSSLDDAMVWDL